MQRQDGPCLPHKALLVDADVIAIAQHGECRGVSGGTADAQFFHALDECRLGKTWRRLGEVLGYLDLVLRERIVRVHRRQATTFFVLFIVLAFLIEDKEAIETYDLSCRAQIDAGIFRGALGLCHDLDGCALEFGRFHLARDGACPDQFIKTAQHPSPAPC